MLLPADYPDRAICVMGLGYVGLTLATVLADMGFDVTGVEVRQDVVEGLRQGRPHFFEPGLAERVRKVVGLGRLRVCTHIPENCEARVYVITVGTPLAPDGRVRMEMIENVSREVRAHLRDGDMVIMRSTVKIGTTRDVVVPILERDGIDYDLAFCPERTLEGQALSELRHLPQIVGGVTMRANIRASQLFQFITPTVVRVNDVETAEMIKLVDNAQRDVQFAYANEVARMCDSVGISAAEVIRAGKLGYPRTNLPMPGPVGGPCLEKDSHILAEALRPLGIVPEITMAARLLNERQMGEVAAHLRNLADTLPDFPARPTITLAGLAFKGRPATDDLRGSTVRVLKKELETLFPGAVLRGFDAVVSPEDIALLGLEPVATLEEAFDGANLVLIHNNHTCFAAMDLECLAGQMAQPGVIYDFWNHFDARDLTLPAGRGYLALGSHAWFRLSEGTR